MFNYEDLFDGSLSKQNSQKYKQIVYLIVNDSEALFLA